MSVQMEVGMDIGIDTASDRDTAEAEAIMRSYREWAAAGRPGAVSHDEFIAELLRG